MAHRTEDQRTTRGRGPRVAVALAVALAVGLGTTPAMATRSGGPGSVEAAVAQGIVERSVLDALRERGQVDALVSVDGSQALAAASRGSSARSLLRQTIPAYEGLKSALPEAGRIVEDYPALPTSLVRFDSEEGLLAAARDPSVVSIQTNGTVRAALAESPSPEATA